MHCWSGSYVLYSFAQVKRGRPSQTSIVEKRKRYRQKKAIHRLGKERWEIIAEERLRQRWRDRAQRVYAADLTHVQDEKEKEDEKKAHEAKLKESNARKQDKRIERADNTEDQHVQYCSTHRDTGPLLLDEVLLPIQEPTPTCSSDSVRNAEYMEQIRIARKERNTALIAAQCYRDMAENSQKEKREIQYKLEANTELVRNFWRNKIIEGSSRSGKMLRAALLRK